MANGDDKSTSKGFYQVLGLNKECTATDLRNAYKKLALRWHPDRCSASENSNFAEEAKKKFQAVQHAYSVLSDANKRFLYDVGVYDSDDDENGMGDFLNEMAVMMSQTKPEENVEESFEELQDLFEELFQEDIDLYESVCQTSAAASDISIPSNKRVAYEMNLGKTKAEGSNFDLHFDKFCFGTGGRPEKSEDGEGSKRRNSRQSHR